MVIVRQGDDQLVTPRPTSSAARPYQCVALSGGDCCAIPRRPFARRRKGYTVARIALLRTQHQQSSPELEHCFRRHRLLDPVPVPDATRASHAVETSVSQPCGPRSDDASHQQPVPEHYLTAIHPTACYWTSTPLSLRRAHASDAGFTAIHHQTSFANELRPTNLARQHSVKPPPMPTCWCRAASDTHRVRRD